jgi:hypothetical protein
MLRRLKLALLVVVTTLLAACASKPQLPVQLAPDVLSGSSKDRVGVALTKVPKPALYLPGADCLLCIIAAQSMNAPLGKHVDTLTVDDLPPLKEQIAAALRKKGVAAQVIAEEIDVSKLADVPASDTEPNRARKDFAPLKQKYGVDKLVVIQVTQVGIQRNYSAYFPTSDPKGVLNGVGYMVNLSRNSYDWYLPVNIQKSADGAWDEPAKYPGLTNAYFQTLELARDSFLKPFSP